MKKANRRKKQDRKVSKKQEGPLLGSLEPGLDRILPVACAVLSVLLFREFVFSDDMLFGTDTIAAGVFFRSFYADFVRTYHSLPLWDPYIFGGIPFVDGMHGDTFYPTTSLKFFVSIFRALGLKLVIHVFLAGVTMYHAARSFGVTRLSSLFAGLSYMLASNLVSLVYGGHGGKMYVIALFPLAIYLLNRGFDRRKLLCFGLLGGVVGLMILTAHIQMAYFALWGLGLYFLYRLYLMRDEGRQALVRVSLCFGLSLLIGVMLSAIQLIPPYIYLNRYSPRAEGGRGYEFATSWSLHAEEIVSLVYPDFCGLDVGEEGTYWGKNFFKINHEYSGVLPLLFGVLAVVFVRRGNMFWMVLALLTLVYSLGANTPLFRLFYEVIPGVKVFRAPSLVTFLFTFSIALLAGKGLDSIRFAAGEERMRIVRILSICAGVIVGFTVLVSVSPQQFFLLWQSLFYSSMPARKLEILTSSFDSIIQGLWFTVFIVGMSAGLLFLTRSSWSRHFPVIILALTAISVIDLWRVDARFIRVVQPEAYFHSDPAIEYLKEQDGKFRVFPAPGTYQYNFLAYHRLEEATGHHGNELRRYRELTEGENLSQLRLLNLLNVRFLVSRGPIQHPLFREVFRSEGSPIVYRNLEYLPRAFVVHQYEVIDTGDRKDVLARLLDESFDYRNSIILEEDPGVVLDEDEAASPDGKAGDEWARIADDDINDFVLECHLERPGFVLISDNYYPSWRAYEGGSEVDIHLADYTFRAIYLDAGDHRVEFRFESVPLRAGFGITAAAFVLIVFLVIRGVVEKRRGRPAGGLSP